MNPLKLITQPGFDYVVPANPTISVNPDKPYVTWLNSSTGELLVCINATIDGNVWRGQFGTEVSPLNNISGLIAYYNMWGSYGDTVPNKAADTYHMDIIGSPVLTEKAGKKTISLNEGDMLKSLTDSVLCGLTEFSLSIWTYLNAVPTSSDFGLILQGTHASSEPFVFWVDYAATNHYTFLFNDSSGHYSGVFYSSSVPAAGAWTNLILTFEAENQARFFVNGVEDANSPFDVSTLLNIKSVMTTNQFLLGGEYTTATGYHHSVDGYVGPTRIYNRVLSSEEIALLAAE